MVLRIADPTARERTQLENEYLRLINEFNQIATEEFGIESIRRGFKKADVNTK